MDTMQQIHDFMIAEFASERTSFTPDENLLSQGIIDSLGILKLVTFLEERFEITTTDEDLVPENFATLTLIRNFVEKKRGA